MIFEEETLEDGRAKTIFRKKANASGTVDFSQNSCSGGACSH